MPLLGLPPMQEPLFVLVPLAAFLVYLLYYVARGR